MVEKADAAAAHQLDAMRGQLGAMIGQQAAMERQEATTAEGLFHARRSADAAFMAAVANERSVTTMRETAERQLRAYVSVDRTLIVGVGHPMLAMDQLLQVRAESGRERPGPPIEASVTIKNTGQTPAYDVKHAILYILDVPGGADFVMPAEATETGSRSILGAGGTSRTRIKVPGLTAVQLSELAAGTLAIHVVGQVSYRDVFGHSRQTRYHYFLPARHGTLPVRSRLLAHADGNEAD